MILMRDGQVFTCGSNEMLQLGRNLLEDAGDVSSSLDVVDALEGIKITNIACWNICACVDQERNLYMWGSLQDQDKRSYYQLPDPVAVPNIKAQSMSISRQSIAVIDARTQHVKMIHCNEPRSSQPD